MKELYWITRLDSLYAIFCIAFTVSLIAFIIAIVTDLMDAGIQNLIKNKYFKLLIATIVISMLGLIFTPTKKEAMLIWGVGGTIDYIKQNETAKKLPGKVLKAIDIYLEEQSKDK